MRCARLAPHPAFRHSFGLGGLGGCPPEDCGGILGFYETLENAGDPRHPDRGDIINGLGARSEDAFSVEHVNARLQRLKD